MTTQRIIDQLIAAIESYGYIVLSEPIVGSEEIYAESLRMAYAQIIAVTVKNQHRYGTHEKSKRGLSLLHTSLPNPAWGIEIR